MTHAFAGFSADTPLGPHTITRRDPGPTDVAIDILFCGVCHSDLHTVKSEWGKATYPCVPGHEIIGRVTAVGASVTSFKPGEMVGVGCMVDSCRDCESCADSLEQYCEPGATFTYNSKDAHLGGVTYGGYSTHIVVDEAFTLRIPDTLDPAAAAPLLCAGITTFSPLRHWNIGTGSRVGVVGLGGLGHLGVKGAHALGAVVTLYTTWEGKVTEGKRLGASRVVVTSPDDGRKGKAHALPSHEQLDLIINTVAVPHNLDPYLNHLNRDGVMVLVGIPPTPHPSPSARKLINRRRSLSGSSIGGIAETQEMLDFCGEHGIVSEIEMIPMQQINEAYERMLRSDVKYRFVIDMKSMIDDR